MKEEKSSEESTKEFGLHGTTAVVEDLSKSARHAYGRQGRWDGKLKRGNPVLVPNQVYGVRISDK